MRYFFIFFLLGYGLSAQEFHWEGQIDLGGFIGSEDLRPFWVHKNSSSRWGEESNFSAAAGLKGTYFFSEDQFFEGQLQFFGRDQVENEVQRNNLYLAYQRKWIKATLGAKQANSELLGLSSSNKNFLMSGNARPLGGILLETSHPIKVVDGLSFRAGIGHYKFPF